MPRFHEVAELVEGALDLEGPERTRFLDRACADDAALRREVESVLAAGLTDDTFLDPLVGVAKAPSPLAPGTRIGPFTITRAIGRGGMGMVFEAQQAAPRRRVAIKVMREQLMTVGARQRFRFEIETLGALNHPGIAQIYQAGIDDLGPSGSDVPWFAMEFVPGASTLLAFAAARDLPRDARLALFARVCDAIHHGHQKGVIHRDIKPDNLLVDGQGNPKVIDFGVARTADPERRRTTLRADAGEIVGTLAYMSPEQAQGEPADVQSDVYALGAVLFELLTGALPVPVEGTDFLACARQITEEPARRASALAPDVGADLDAVLHQALAKDPAHRYASAAALAADLGRARRGEPVEAREPGAWRQALLFARRHRALVFSAGIVGLVLVVAAAVSLAFAFKSQRAEETARTRSQEAEAQRARATRLFESTLERGVESTTRLIPQVHALPRGAPIAAALVESTIAELEELESFAADDPDVALALASAYVRLGDVAGNPNLANLGERERGFDAYARAFTLAERAIDSPRASEALQTAALALRRRVEVRQGEGRHPASRPDLERALELAHRALGAAGPDETRMRAELEIGLIHHLLSVDAKVAGELDRAEAHARKALDRIEAARDAPGGDPVDLARHRAAKTYWLGVVLLAADDVAGARDAFLDAQAAVGDVPADRHQRLDHALYTFSLGSAERRLGHFEQADANLEAALEQFTVLRREDPDDARVLPHLISCVTEWVRAGERRTDLPTTAGTAAGRERARAGASRIEALSGDSAIAAGYVAWLRRFADG